jgi:hypothetical protein
MTCLQDITRLKIKRVRPVKRMKMRSGRIPMHLLTEQIDHLAEQEELMSRYEHGQEVG